MISLKVPLGTVQKIFNGETKAPRYETLRALEKVLRPHKTDMICEALIEYGKKEGDYTLDDYYRLPEERRVELIDGTFYDMAAPSLPHQMVVIEVASELYSEKGREVQCVFCSGGCTAR